MCRRPVEMTIHGVVAFRLRWDARRFCRRKDSQHASNTQSMLDIYDAWRQHLQSEGPSMDWTMYSKQAVNEMDDAGDGRASPASEESEIALQAVHQEWEDYVSHNDKFKGHGVQSMTWSQFLFSTSAAVQLRTRTAQAFVRSRR